MENAGMAPTDIDNAGCAPWWRADWGPTVSAVFSDRSGGHSVAPYATCNLGDHVGDDLATVALNRRAFEAALGAPAVWMTQVHGHRVLTLHHDMLTAQAQGATPPQADGAITAEPGLGCVVMVADCLPVLLAAPEGRAVGALHAGWRGLAGAGDMGGRGILEVGVPALCELASCDPADVRVWLGPCIGPQAFEVGAAVLEAFGVVPSSNPAQLPETFQCQPLVAGQEPRWRANLPALASQRLQALGVRQVQVSGACTVSEPGRFFSFRRDGVTGRMAAGIALRSPLRR
jgi:hypothetical protein